MAPRHVESVAVTANLYQVLPYLRRTRAACRDVFGCAGPVSWAGGSVLLPCLLAVLLPSVLLEVFEERRKLDIDTLMLGRE